MSKPLPDPGSRIVKEKCSIPEISLANDGSQPHEWHNRSGGLTPDEKALLDKLAWVTVRQILHEKGLLGDNDDYVPPSLKQ